MGSGAGKGDRARQRILVAVEPKMLSQSLAHILGRRAATDVELVNVGEDDDGRHPSGHFDAAIVTIDLTGVDADVVIELPDHEVHVRGLVTQEGATDAVELDSLDALFALLDERLPPSGE